MQDGAGGGVKDLGEFAKTEQGQYPAISTVQAWSIKDLLYGIKLAGQSPYPERARGPFLESPGKFSGPKSQL